MRSLSSILISIRRVVFGLVVVCVFGTVAFGQPWAGSGTAEDPYQIWDACDMQAIGADANYWDAHFVLCEDINLGGYTGSSYNIIGRSLSNSFTGVFDGNENTISNFIYESNDVNYVGFFGYVDGGEIGHLGVIEPNIDAGAGEEVGSLVGELYFGSVTDYYIEGGSVSGGRVVGGVVGKTRFGIVCDSHSYTNVSGISSVGGLVGYNLYGDISKGYSRGGTSGTSHVGGLVGENHGDILDSYSKGSVSGYSRVGGIAGWNYYGNISNSYSTGSILGDYDVGGLAGYNSGASVITSSYSQGIVSGYVRVGGLVGENHITINRCYAKGRTSGDFYVGGLVGMNYGEISNSYSTGVVSAIVVASAVGGLVGWDQSGFYERSFWDSDVNPDVNGIGNANDPNVIGKTRAEMQTRSTFVDAGWDFVGELVNGPNDIWDICEGMNYPKFVWQKRAADFVCPDGVNFVDYAFFAEYWLQRIYGECGGVELTGDGKVNWVDFAVFAEYWKLTGCGECGGADFTGEGDVDLADLGVFSEHWLQTEYAEVDLTEDGQVNLNDLRQFVENWLAGIE